MFNSNGEITVHAEVKKRIRFNFIVSIKVVDCSIREFQQLTNN